MGCLANADCPKPNVHAVGMALWRTRHGATLPYSRNAFVVAPGIPGNPSLACPQVVSAEPLFPG